MEVDWLLPNARDRERWREGRRLADRGFRSGAISLNHQTIEEKTRWFLDQLLATPAEFRGHIELSVVLFVRSCFRWKQHHGHTDFKRKLSCLSCTDTT